MTSQTTLLTVHHPLTASRDLWREWRSCCLRAGGWDEELLDAPLVFEGKDIYGESNVVTVISLVNNGDGNEEQQDEDHMVDGWIGAVREIEKNMNRMIAWFHEKKRAYSSVHTPDEEASLIQSTIASYTASTANELEELRSVLLTKERSEYAHRPQEFEHHNIMVQTLLQRLKGEVAEPFGKFQKLRQREAVKLWQNPLRVELYLPPVEDDDEMDAALGISSSRDHPDQRFIPQRPRLPLQAKFMDAYNDAGHQSSSLEKPVSLFSKRSKRDAVSPTASSSPPQIPPDKRRKPFTSFATKTGQRPSANPQHHVPPNMGNEDDLHYAQPQDLEQEAVLLKASLENDLDQIQKMETTMVNITTLLSQFADLVAGQQEDIMHIHDAAETTKENLDKGQEKLLDAADRTQQSKHYMATAITAMGVMLLVIHWIRP